jgi:hypothetical protein
MSWGHSSQERDGSRTASLILLVGSGEKVRPVEAPATANQAGASTPEALLGRFRSQRQIDRSDLFHCPVRTGLV